MKSKNVYSFPIKNESMFLAVSDSRAHYDHFKHAIDFLTFYETEILAPLDGEIWNVKDDATEGGDDEKYIDWKYQNLITIRHANEEFSQYVHLAPNSCVVKIGDKVKKGQVIAKGIGMIGCTTAPHLHMMVFKESGKNKDKFESLEIQFEKKLKICRTEKESTKEINKSKYKKLKGFLDEFYSSKK